MTADPVIKKTPSGDDVATFSIATNKRWKDKDGNKKESVEFHNCVVWNRPAEVITEYGRKGLKIFVEGELVTRNWEDDDGHKNYRTEIRVLNFEFLGAKPRDDEPVQTTAPDPGPAAPDDLPF